jgi:hypothetical protein
MPDWSIQILATGSGSAAFLPIQQGGQVGGALIVSAGDTVMWRNTTGQYHQPWTTDEHFIPLRDEAVKPDPPINNFLSYPIPPEQPAPAAYGIDEGKAGKTIFYCCKLHPEEHGVILVRGSGGQ